MRELLLFDLKIFRFLSCGFHNNLLKYNHSKKQNAIRQIAVFSGINKEGEVRCGTIAFAARLPRHEHTNMDFDNKNQAGGINELPGVPYEDDSPEEIIIEEAESDVIETSFTAAQVPPAPRPVNIHSANEYIYNDGSVPEGSRQSKGGRIALTAIAAVLAVFVVSVTSISAYIAVTENRTQPDIEPSPNGSNLSMFPSQPPEGDKSPLPVTTAVTDGAVPTEDKSAEAHPENVSSQKSYPSLEQLAAPENAMALPDIYDKVSPSVVGVSCTLARSSATGTGIIISEDGYIITNAHVVEDALSIMIVDSRLNEYEAKVVGADSQTDLAVLKVEASGLTPCEFGKSGELRIGELAVVIGNPLGLDLYGTMTTGIISGLNRTITIGENKMTLIQTQASINKGNSGGPLINAYGQIIGITSAKVNSAYGEGLGFAIPIDEALPIVDDLMEHGYVTGRPMIGISGEDITYIMSLYYRLPQGVCVRFITPESGAEAAGIKAGDIIIGVNDSSISTMDELTEAKNQFSAGDTITLNIYRDGVSMNVVVVLSETTNGSSN